MAKENGLFSEYSDEKKGLFKQSSKFWLAVFAFLLGFALLVLFYKFVIKDSMSHEELNNSIQIVWHDSVWLDKEVSPYETKIVPSITIRVKNIGERPLHRIEFHGVFVFAENDETLSDGYSNRLTKSLAAGETSEDILIKSFYGYSAKSKASFLKNQEKWKKIAVRIFARSQGSGLVRIGEKFPIKQKIQGINIDTDEAAARSQEFMEAMKEIGKSIQIVWKESKWVENKGAVGKTMIVPSISIKIKNTGEKPLQRIGFKGVFIFEESEKRLGEGFTLAFKKPLPPGNTSEEIKIQSDLGYIASSMKAFFENLTKWKNLKVQIFARKDNHKFILLGIFPIKKEIEGVKVIYQ